MKPHYWAFLALVTLASLGMQVLGPESAHAQSWDRVPLFYGAYGFVGCTVIVVVAKALGKWWLQKREDYYDRDA
jgi:hypothetical protein